jgi:hypothetical protein
MRKAGDCQAIVGMTLHVEPAIGPHMKDLVVGRNRTPAYGGIELFQGVVDCFGP